MKGVVANEPNPPSMPVSGAPQPWRDAHLRSIGPVLTCLVAIALAQSDTLGASQCEMLREELGHLSTEIVLDDAVLRVVRNDLQTLLNCMPARGVVKLVVSDLPLGSVLEIKRPITIEGNGASIQCPNENQEKGLRIRSDDVIISNLFFEGCEFNTTVGLIDVKNSRNVTLEDVQFIENKNGAGPGCISAAMSEIQLLKVEARNNSGLLGGVLFAELNSNITIMGSNFRNNIASKRGGALYLHNSNVRIVDATFEGNRAPDGGGAVFAEGTLPSTFFSENVTFSENGAHKQDEISEVGGAVALMAPQLTAEIKTTLFVRNFAKFFGGGMMVNTGENMSILDCHFIENSATTGGALLAQALAPNITNLEVRGTTFESNSARGNVAGFSNNFGGAIALLGNGTFVNILDASFSDNMAEGRRGIGGAISGSEIRSIEISRSTFNRNQVAEAKPGGLINQLEDDDEEQKKKEVQTEDEIIISRGGAISLNDIPVISIQNSTFTANQALIGGAIDIINVRVIFTCKMKSNPCSYL
ncbi:hypothetical protein BSKO_06774 [Bryopsis sp. KO-2023]|nr:hypothetical protein BSKO_06774 [Bryopsis sp. KO-2023]